MVAFDTVGGCGYPGQNPLLLPFFIYGSVSKPAACNKAGAHTRDIPGYKGYVTGARLARQALQF